MARTRVKICGLTRRQDAQAAVANGADAIGLVFYPPSPRSVSIEQAIDVAQGLPAFVTVTALFVDASETEIQQVLAAVPIDLLQFHGNESPEDCMRFSPKPWVKAVRMQEGLNLHQLRDQYAQAASLLLDAYQAGVPGGTGKQFDWSSIPADMSGEIILAGGLDAENVTQAIQQVRPFAVDVSGGVERAKGIKDANKIAAFIKGVKRGDEG